MTLSNLFYFIILSRAVGTYEHVYILRNCIRSFGISMIRRKRILLQDYDAILENFAV
jgi:hypothetical protein